ncbi:hypothetical protein ACE6H2_026482 [Prunus campanulata]
MAALSYPFRILRSYSTVRKSRMSEMRRCFCGGFARLETSSTKDNPRRRFWTCCRKRIDKAEGELRRSCRRDKLLWFFIVIGIVIAMHLANTNGHKGSSGMKTVLELA